MRDAYTAWLGRMMRYGNFPALLVWALASVLYLAGCAVGAIASDLYGVVREWLK